jgi:hypothetical protein
MKMNWRCVFLIVLFLVRVENMSVKIYEGALEQAQNDLVWITREFERLRTRKELLENFVGALMPLISNLNSVDDIAASPECAAHEAPALQEG